MFYVLIYLSNLYLPWSIWAAETKYHRTVVYKQHKFIPQFWNKVRLKANSSAGLQISLCIFIWQKRVRIFSGALMTQSTPNGLTSQNYHLKN